MRTKANNSNGSTKSQQQNVRDAEARKFINVGLTLLTSHYLMGLSLRSRDAGPGEIEDWLAELQKDILGLDSILCLIGTINLAENQKLLTEIGARLEELSARSEVRSLHYG